MDGLSHAEIEARFGGAVGPKIELLLIGSTFYARSGGRWFAYPSGGSASDGA